MEVRKSDIKRAVRIVKSDIKELQRNKSLIERKYSSQIQNSMDGFDMNSVAQQYQEIINQIAYKQRQLAHLKQSMCRLGVVKYGKHNARLQAFAEENGAISITEYIDQFDLRLPDQEATKLFEQQEERGRNEWFMPSNGWDSDFVNNNFESSEDLVATARRM